MPKKIDPAVKERVVRRVLEHRAEYSSLTAAAAAVAKIERLGTETVRRWVLQAWGSPRLRGRSTPVNGRGPVAPSMPRLDG